MTNGLACKDMWCPSPLCGMKNWEAKSLSLVICNHYSQQVVVGSAGLAITTQAYASLMGLGGELTMNVLRKPGGKVRGD